MMECYVCTDPLKKRHVKVCSCENLYLHSHCQQRLLETVSKDGRCTICRCPYANIRKRHWAMGRIFLLYTAATAVFTGTFLGAMICITQLLETSKPRGFNTMWDRDRKYVFTDAWVFLIQIVVVHASSALFMRYYLHCLIHLSESVHLTNWVVYDAVGAGIRRLASVWSDAA